MPPFVVDNTILKTTQCSLQSWLRHGRGLSTNEERGELLSGQAVHRILEQHYRGVDVNGCLRDFDLLYGSWARMNIDPDDRLSYENYSTILKYWLETHPIGGLPYTPIPDLIEIPFEAPLDEHGDFLFVGNIDLGAYYSGGLVIVEHKTTGRITEPWADKWHLDSQLTGYIYGAIHGVHSGTKQPLSHWIGSTWGEPVRGALINAIEFPKLPQDVKRKCYSHGVPQTECRLLHAKAQLLGEFIRPEGFLMNWRATALGLAKHLKNLLDSAPRMEDIGLLPQEGMFYNTCQFCEYKRICTTPLDPKLIEGRLFKAKWNPRTRMVE